MKFIGEHLGRGVFFHSAKENNNMFKGVELSNAVVLLLCSTEVGSGKLEDNIKRLVQAEPLAILLAEGAVSGFDFLLRLAAESPTPHIMTSVCDESKREAIEMLLNATWPADERFDEWERYTILVLDNGTLAKKTENELEARLV